MKALHKIIAGLSALALTVGFLPFCRTEASAADTSAIVPTVVNPDFTLSEASDSIVPLMLDIDRYTYSESSSTYKQSINVYQYALTSYEATCTFFDAILFQHPEVFFLDNGYSMTSTGSRMLYINIELAKTPEETKADIASFIEETDRITALASALPTEEDKALYLHEYLASNCKYNENIANGTTPKPSVYFAGGAIIDRDAVCQGYSLAYKYLLSRVGVISEVVTSTSMNHAWNLVNLGDSWYHVDITWDDPVWDRTDMVNHSNFLVSSDTFVSGGHTAWDDLNTACQTTTAYSISDASYEDNELATLTTPAAYVDGAWYYTKFISFTRYEIVRTYDIFADSPATVTVKSVYHLHYSSEDGYVWEGVFSAPSVYGNRIYYNTDNDILCCDLDGSNEQTLYTYTKPSKIYNIYGTNVTKDGAVEYMIISDLNESLTANRTVYTVDSLGNNRYVGENGIVYTLTESDAVIGNSSDLAGAGYIGTATEITVPASITVDGTEYPVTAIEKNAFADTALTSVTFEGAQPECGANVFGTAPTLTVYYNSENGWSISSDKWQNATAIDLALIGTEITVTDPSVSVENGTVYGVEVCTDVASFMAMLDGEYEIYKGEEKITDGYVGTGYTVYRIKDGEKKQSAVISIVGDIYGDGMRNAKDILAIKLSLVNEFAPDTHAADINGDGMIDKTDAAQLAQNVNAN